MAGVRAFAGAAVALAALASAGSAGAFWPANQPGYGATAAPAPAASSSHPTLAIVATNPVRVHGARFRPGETVRLTARAGAGARRGRAVADRRGAFRATVARVVLAGCHGVTVTAVGASADRAVARLPRLAC
jgi:hypothetical protein